MNEYVSTSMLVLAAVLFGMVALVVRVVRLMSRPRAELVSTPRGKPGHGVAYAFTWGMLPWNKESGRTHPWVFWSGVLYHVAIVSSLLLLVERLVLDKPAGITWLLGIIAAIGAAIGAANLLRRIWEPHMRAYSGLDDYLSLLFVSAFMGSVGLYGLGAAPTLWVDLTAVVMALYLPFSKVRHMFTFFIARYYHGEQMGQLGIYAPGVKPGGGLEYDVEALRVEENDAPHEKPVAVPIMSRDQRQQVVAVLEQGATRQRLAMVDACVHCGMCAEACHYYLAYNDERMIPVVKADHVTRAFRSKELLDGAAAELHQAAYEHCSLCGRCGLSCPMGINTGEVMTWARNAFGKAGAAPEGLKKPAAVAVEKGNYLGLPVDDVLENLEWLSEELEEELEQEGIVIPVDVEGKEILYVPHPLELRDFPMVVLAAAKIFHRAGASYTFSSDHFDTVNYAYYGGDKERMKSIIQHLVTAAEKLGVKRVVLSPCGHGYKVLRWESEKVLGRKLPFEIVSLSELIDEYVRDRKITLKKGSIEGAVTYHDPCNIARLGGVIEEPRRVLGKVTDDFVEMTPSGALNFCCSGGGGLAATADYGTTRLGAGAVKAQQMKNSGAGTVVSNCFNCNTQLKELNRKYALGMEVVSITEVVADAME